MQDFSIDFQVCAVLVSVACDKKYENNQCDRPICLFGQLISIDFLSLPSSHVFGMSHT